LFTRLRLGSAARWLAPSAAAACGGAIAAGAVEGASADGALAIAASAGFLALAAWPIVLVASTICRGLWAAWRPGELELVEAGGGAPRLAAWLVVILAGALVLAWAVFQGVWVLAAWTAFKALGVSLVLPVIAVGTVIVIVIVSRPAARGLAYFARRLDARWRKRHERSLLTPAKIATSGGLLAAAVVYALWRLVVRPKLGHVPVELTYPPAAAIAMAGAVHAAWARLPRTAGVVLGAVLAALVGTALFAWRAEPSLTLAIWGERPLAGFAIDQLFDLDAIRERVPLTQFSPTPVPGARHPDIVLITIDTVRADHTPPYNGSAEMPNLRALADRGTVFERAFSPSNVTRRSIPSMIIGLTPDRVRGRVVGWALRIDPRHVVLAERLLAGGYATAGFMCCEGFWGNEMRTGLQRGLAHLEIEPNGAQLARLAKAWLGQRKDDRPLFVWMHILEPHNWQTGNEPRTDDDRRRLYDRALAASDAMLGELLAAFPAGRAPIAIVTADHGEGLGDHGQPYHSTDLYDSQTHVPLVIAGPGIAHARVAETVSLTDLVPTILELAGFEAPRGAAIDGRSIADLATGRRTPDPEAGVAIAAMIKDRSNPGGVTAIVKGRWKLIENGSTLELYDVQGDPDEKANLVGARRGPVDELQRLLREHRETAKQSPFE
jgi:arylsulfatase A-like enzyme